MQINLTLNITKIMDIKKEYEDFFKTEYTDVLYNHNSFDVIAFAKHYQALQLRQCAVSGSFNKCTCLHPRPSCLTGHCTICNRPIIKNITTDDLKNCH